MLTFLLKDQTHLLLNHSHDVGCIEELPPSVHGTSIDLINDEVHDTKVPSIWLESSKHIPREIHNLGGIATLGSKGHPKKPVEIEVVVFQAICRPTRYLW